MDDRYGESHHETPQEWWRHHLVVPTLVTLLTLSLLLHLLTFASLLRVRANAIGQLQAFTKYTEQVEQDTIKLDFQINQPVPVNASFPIRQSFTVPIKTTLPISQSIEVNTPLGTLPLPVQMEFPVDLQVPIAVSQTVDISTTVNLNTTVPIAIPLKDTSLAGYLNQLRQALQDLANDL